MSKFVLTAQLQLQAPRNTNQVLTQMRQQLSSGVTVPVSAKGAAQAQKQITQVANATQKAATAAESMGKSFGLATKRFAAFTVASRAVSLLTNSLANSIAEAIDFQREMVKIAQVSGKTMGQLKGLQNTITGLASSLGTSSTELLKVTRILAQAGVQANDLEVALAALAKTTLAATFDNIENTAEGAVAILRQFGEGVGALERQLGAINAVAGQFAVESGDLIGAVRRFGGVFKSAGGSLEELLAIFTSVRATTRESAESISTGLRTIFTRIQRPKTISYLRQLGIELTDAEGKFVGPMKAAQLLSEALSGLAEGDLRFVKIAEELGGFRQIGKVIPLLQQFETAQLAYNAAVDGGNSLNKDAATAQQALAVQIEKVREEFQGLVRTITDSSSFQIFVRTSLELASALIKVGEALAPLLPLLATMGGIKLMSGLGGFMGGIGSAIRGKNHGGRVLGFNRGGLVPGTGNRDTVPAMLSPGEFVIRQSSVKKLGASRLQAMNNNRFAEGGEVGILAISSSSGSGKKEMIEKGKVEAAAISKAIGSINWKGTSGNFSDDPGAGTPFLKGGRWNPNLPAANKNSMQRLFNKNAETTTAYGFPLKAVDGDTATIEDDILSDVSDGIKRGINNIGSRVGGLIGITKISPATNDTIAEVGAASMIGKMFEAGMTLLDSSKLSGTKKSKDEGANPNAAFDYANGIGSKIAGKLGDSQVAKKLADIPTDAKKMLYKGKDGLKDSITKKRKNVIAEQVARSEQWAAEKRSALQAMTQTRKNAGGGIGGTDTVPALLTPGEFVINKSAAQSIGYANLNRMNTKGVTGFAQGGPVGVQKFAMGGAVGFAAVAGIFQQAVANFGDKSEEASDKMFRNTVIFESSIKALTRVIVGFFVFKEVAKQMKNFGESIQNWASGPDGKFESDATAQSKADAEQQRQANAVITGEAESKAVGGESAMGDISQATFSVGSAIINIQSQQAAGGAAGDPGRPEVDLAGEYDLSTGRGMVDKKSSISDINAASQERASMEADAEDLRARAKSRMMSDSGGGSIEARLQRAQAREAEVTSPEAKKRIKKKREELSLAEGINPKTGKRKNDKGGNITANPEKAAKLRAELEAIERVMADAAQETRDAQASFDLAEKEMREMEAAADQLDQQIEASTKSSKEAIRIRKAELAARKANAARQAESKRGLKILGKQFGSFNRGLRELGAKMNNAGRKTDAYRTKLIKANNMTIKNTKGWSLNAIKTRNAARASKGLNVSLKMMGRGLKGAGRFVNLLGRDARKSIKPLQALGRRIKDLGRSAARGVGRGIAKGANVIGGVGMGMNAIAGVGSAITGAMRQVADREKQQAIKSGDTAGAAKAAGQAALSEGMGEVFTAGGFFEAVFDPSGFVERRQKRKESAEAETATQVAVSNTQATMEEIGKQGSTAFRTAEGDLDVASLSSNISKDAQEARNQISDLDPKEQKKLRAELDASMRASIQTIASRNVSEAEAVAMAEELAGGNAELRDQYVALAKSTVALRVAQQALAKANFDSLKMTSAFSGANAAVDNLINGLQTGSSELGGFINSIKTAQSTIGVDASSAIDQGEEALLAAAGGNKALSSSIRGQANVARAANQFSQNIGGSITEGDFSRSDSEKAKTQLRERLLAAIPDDADDATRKSMEAAIEGRLAGITDENVATTDISELLGGISEDANKQAAGFTESLELLNKHNSTMTKLYQQREQLELKAAQAMNKAIDIQLEAAKIFESFGGAALTTDQRTEARTAQFNNIGAMAGVQLGGSGAADIRRAGEQLSNIVTSQNQMQFTDTMVRGAVGDKAGPGVFAGAQGVQQDKREEAKRANEALIQFTKQRVSLLKEELAIVQKKNAAEKSSLEKLLAGDVEGFISGQAAAGAGAALATGDAGLAGLFGASALGAGFKTLEGQGLSDAQMQQAAGLSLGAVGINDTRSAQLLAGTTAEEEAIKSEGRELAGVMGDLAQNQAEFEKAEIAIQDAVINATNATFSREVEAISNRNVQPLARGGMVYASRGMFVPRGTDTVPAMLTPGEFVVNRNAVQRGNNLQILRAMNGRGQGGSNAVAMSNGGSVGYYQDGGSVEAAAGSLASVIPNLQNVFSDFAATVDKLVSTKFQVALDPTNVNVNFNGASFLETMKEDIKTELLNEVGEQIKKAKPNTSGDLKTGNTVLGN